MSYTESQFASSMIAIEVGNLESSSLKNGASGTSKEHNPIPEFEIRNKGLAECESCNSLELGRCSAFYFFRYLSIIMDADVDIHINSLSTALSYFITDLPGNITGLCDPIYHGISAPSKSGYNSKSNNLKCYSTDVWIR